MPKQDFPPLPQEQVLTLTNPDTYGPLIVALALEVILWRSLAECEEDQP